MKPTKRKYESQNIKKINAHSCGGEQEELDVNIPDSNVTFKIFIFNLIFFSHSDLIILVCEKKKHLYTNPIHAMKNKRLMENRTSIMKNTSCFLSYIHF